MTADGTSTPAVTVRGASTLTLTAGEQASGPSLAERSFTIHCHSGRTIEGRWRGVPLAPAITAAEFPPETTHVSVTAADGYAAVATVREASAAFLGFDRVAIEVTGGEPPDPPGIPRFLGPDLDSTQVVRSVARIEALQVPPGADPAEVAATE